MKIIKSVDQAPHVLSEKTLHTPTIWTVRTLNGWDPVPATGKSGIHSFRKSTHIGSGATKRELSFIALSDKYPSPIKIPAFLPKELTTIPCDLRSLALLLPIKPSNRDPVRTLNFYTCAQVVILDFEIVCAEDEMPFYTLVILDHTGRGAMRCPFPLAMKLGLGLLTRFEQIVLEEVRLLSPRRSANSAQNLVIVHARKVPVGQHRNYPKMALPCPSFQYEKAIPATVIADAAQYCVEVPVTTPPSVAGTTYGLTGLPLVPEITVQNLLQTPIRSDKPMVCEEGETEEDSGYVECDDWEFLACHVALEEEEDIFSN